MSANGLSYILDYYKNYSIIPHELIIKLQQITNYEQTKDIKSAVQLCQKALIKFPNQQIVLHYLGILNLQLGQPKNALEYIDKAIKINSKEFLLYVHAGIANCQLGHIDNGINFYKHALELNPQFGEAYYNLALALAQKKKFYEAEENFYSSIQHNYVTPVLHYNLGNILYVQKKLEQAIFHYQKAIELNPAYLECAYNLGDIFIEMSQFDNALMIFRKILHHKPDWIEIHFKIGLAYYNLKKFKEAAQHLDIASALPNPIIFLRLGACYNYLHDLNKQRAAYEQGLTIFPENFELITDYINLCKNCCLWDNLDSWIIQAIKTVGESKLLFFASHILLNLNLQQELIFATKIAQHTQNKTEALKNNCRFEFKNNKKRKIRLGYISSNIRNHPNSHLIMNMFPAHNKENFETYLYSTGPRDQSYYAICIPTFADMFVDLYNKDTETAAKKIYQHEIDILIDLTGYSKYSPTAILALRPAPLQVRFLGPCGTSGSDFVDYLVVDKTVVLPGEDQYYSEKLIYMPNTYFITDNQQRIGAKTTRLAHGLPKDIFIFCCFNGARKLEPVSFKSWMNILHRVPNSVLWLFVTETITRKNLINEVKKYNIDTNRIIFASRIPKEEHLARLQLADLFLDCFFHTAHTTAIDALWAELPIITLCGQNIAQRGASSILKAIGLPELIATNILEFEEKTVYLASNPSALHEIKRKIIANKNVMPLFNTELFVRQLEMAFMQAWEYHKNKQPPHHIVI
jgi:protein O-GlcNAc transferase